MPDDVAGDDADDGADERNFCGEKESEFAAAGNAVNGEAAGIDFGLAAEPGDGAFEIFERDAVEGGGQGIEAEVGEGQGGVAVGRECRGGFPVEAAAGAAEGDDGGALAIAGRRRGRCVCGGSGAGGIGSLGGRNEEESSEALFFVFAGDGADDGARWDVVAFDAQACDVAKGGGGGFDGDLGGSEFALEVLIVGTGVGSGELHGPEEAHGIEGAVGAGGGALKLKWRVASGVDGAVGGGGEVGAGFPAATGVVDEPSGEADAFVGEGAGEAEVDGFVDEGGIGRGGEVEGASGVGGHSECA